MNIRKKVAIVFIYLVNNLGDDLFLRHICQRYPDVDFYVSVKDVKKSEIFADLDNLYYSCQMAEYFKDFDAPVLPERVKKFYNEFDACIFLGGSIFMQFNQSWRQKLHNFKNRMALNKNTYILGANFGPFIDPDFLIAHSNAFTTLKDLCFRDSLSAAYFPDATNVRYAPDILFGYNYEKKEQKNTVAISLINSTWAGRPAEQLNRLKTSSEAYTEKIVEICSEISRRGLGVLLISFCDRQGDLSLAKIIEQKCLLNGVTDIEVQSYNGNYIEALDAFSSSKAVIATRFHAMILGFVFGKPVYPIIYDSKQKYVLQDLNFYGDLCNFDEIADADAKTVVDCLIDPNSKNSYEYNRENVEKAIKGAELQFSMLDKILKRD